jgi:anti-sigma regulatory factor (Ser/Thr protein kinase)
VNQILSSHQGNTFSQVLEWWGGPAASARVVSFTGTDHPVQDAREAVQEAYAEVLGARLPDALLVVSELVTNAASHTAGVRNLVMHDDGGVTSLTVLDKGGTPTWPRVAESDPLAESGRGLRLVDALSDSWDARPVIDGGKAVTAVFLHGTPGTGGQS